MQDLLIGISNNLLLDEERSEVFQLPEASTSESDQLDNGPVHNAGISSFTQISERSLSFSGELLFSSNLENLLIESLDSFCERLNLTLLLGVEFLAITDLKFNIDFSFDLSQPALRLWLKADSVITTVNSGECELSIWSTSLVDDPVVVIKYFL